MVAGAVALDKANGRVVYRFHARDLHLVMGPSSRGSTIRFRVLLDGHPPGNAHGIDIDEQGNGAATGNPADIGTTAPGGPGLHPGARLG